MPSVPIIENILAYIKEYIGVLRYWPFVMGIHRSPVDSHHKGPVVQSPFACHDVIIYTPTQTADARCLSKHHLKQRNFAKIYFQTL